MTLNPIALIQRSIRAWLDRRHKRKLFALVDSAVAEAIAEPIEMWTKKEFKSYHYLNRKQDGWLNV